MAFRQSLRSRRRHKAWGVSPRGQNTIVLEARECERQNERYKLPAIEAHDCRPFNGLNSVGFDPGAYAPGFMPAPAPQALVQSQEFAPVRQESFHIAPTLL